jgi:hypothetical protein
VDVAGIGADDFQERINQALISCAWFVLVLTPDALASIPGKRGVALHKGCIIVTSPIVQRRLLNLLQLFAQTKHLMGRWSFQRLRN